MKADKRILIGAAIAALLAFGLMQFWPQNLTNPTITATPEWDSERTKTLAEQACFDCHSNETEWPWYAHVIPAGILLEKDVLDGRKILNFSQWEETCCSLPQIDDMAATVNKREMPPPYYIILHPDADLNDTERGELVNGLIKTMNAEIGN
ncbi:MAG: heme-binding domain-containing protein [Chloroflexota bacterium]